MAIENNVFIDITNLGVLKEVHEKLKEMFLEKKVKIESELDTEKYIKTDIVHQFILMKTGPEDEDNRIYLNHTGNDCDFIAFIDSDDESEEIISQIIFGDDSCPLITCGDKCRLSIV